MKNKKAIFTLFLIALNISYFSPKVLLKTTEYIQQIQEGQIGVWGKISDKTLYFSKIKSISVKELEKPYIPIRSKGKLLKMLKEGFWYPSAVLADSIVVSYDNFGDKKDLKELVRFYDRYISSNGEFKRKGIVAVLDNSMHGNIMLYLYEITENKKYLNACKYIYNFLKHHVKANNGVLPYRYERDSMILVDSLAFICPFLMHYGRLQNDSEAVRLSEIQILDFIDNSVDIDTGLPFHGHISGRKGYVGICGWGRGTGWYLYALLGFLEHCPSNNQNRDKILAALKKVATSLELYQKNDGSWSWAIIDPYANSEMSATAMIAYNIEKAIKFGFLPDTYYSMLDKAANVLMKQTTSIGFLMGSEGDCQGVGEYSADYGHYSWGQGPATAFFALYLARNKSEIFESIKGD